MNNKLKNKVPLLLTITGCLGVIGTGVATVKATLRAKNILENEKFTRKEKFKKAFKYYISPCLIGGATISCILSAQVLNMRTQATLVSAYAFLNETHNEYKDAIQNVFGEDAVEKIDIYVDGGYVEKFEKQNPDNVVVIDNFLKIPFEISMVDLVLAESELNRTYALRGYASLYDFYAYLGLTETYADCIDELILSQKFGWSIDIADDWGYAYIDFSHKKCTDDNGNEYYILSYDFEPVLEYMYAWEE